VVSVLFADLVDFTAASDGADPEDVRRRVQPFHTTMREIVEGYGGRIEKLMGDGVLAVFGVPVVHEDDAERAVRAALQIHERIGDLGVAGLEARVAVGTGEAVVLLDGATADREGVLGDVVNTASRLQGEAVPGTVLVDETTHRATRRAFVYEERPPVVVRGKNEPLAVWVPVQPVARLGAELATDTTSLVGRDSELGLLVEAYTRSMADRTSQLVTIVGEPGVGKSRLVRELRRHVDLLPDLIRWRQGRCLPYGESITFWALGEIVKAEAGILETDSPATALGKLTVSLEQLVSDVDERRWINGRLSPLVGADHEATSDRQERFAAWHRYVDALAEQRPTVLVVEDLHWADPNLVDFLGGLNESVRDAPLLLVCTARPEFFDEHSTWGAGRRNAVTIRLEPLDESHTGSLLDELLGGEDLDAGTRSVVLDRSGGNPLWAQEFVRMLRDGAGVSAVPESVQAVVAARVDLLDAPAKTIIQAASTVGKTFWRGAIVELIDESVDLDGSLRELEHRELIRRERSSTVAGETEYVFTHSVVRDVSYGQSPRNVRAERHHRVARWIERIARDRVSDRAEVIAHHDSEALRLATSTDLADVTRFADAAIDSHRLAAEQAARLDAEAAVQHLEAALALTTEGDERLGPVRAELGRVYMIVGRSDDAMKLLQAAVDEFDRRGDAEQWGLAMARLAQMAWIGGDTTSEYTLEAIERLERFPPGPALAKVYSHRAGRLWLRGGVTDETLEFIERVRSVVETHGDPEARRRLITAEAGSRFDAGEPAAVELFRQVLRLAIESDDTLSIGSAYLNLGEQLINGWGVDEALPVHERGLEVVLQRRGSGMAVWLQLSIANDYFLVGRWDDALAAVAAALEHPEPITYLETTLRTLRSTIEAARGRTSDGVNIAEAVAQAEALGDLQAVMPVYDSAAWMAMLDGDEASAVEYSLKVVESSGATRFLVDQWALIPWVLRLGGELDRLVDLAESMHRFDMPRPRAQQEWLRGLQQESSDPAAALGMIDAAAATLAELGVRLEAAIAWADVSRIARSIDDEDRASVAAARVRDILGPAGAVRLLERLGLGG
jgi:class 3 adenylate cyclase/tetratricopeptide (TPR) repeat protein